ncbi:MAG: hypothetical protein WDW38_009227 [Sanguina aurantia]
MALQPVLKHSRVLRRHLSTRTQVMTETSVFLEEIAMASTPPRLEALMRVLVARGEKPLSPSSRTGLHPLLIPLSLKPQQPGSSSSDGSSSGSSEVVTCLLRWPEPSAVKGMSLPVVEMTRGALGMSLVARSVDECLHRLLAQEDSEAGVGPRPFAAACGPEGRELYPPGALLAHDPAGRLPIYLVKRCGLFPDVCEALCEGHLGRGDKTSALVAAEWYSRSGNFPSWGRPLRVLLLALHEAGTARGGQGHGPRGTAHALLQALAQLDGTPEQVRFQLSDQGSAAASAQVTKFAYKEPRSDREVAVDAAAKILDLVAAGSAGSYDDIRDKLASAYREGGLTDIANFIAAA